jgi:hypothetical protein
MSDSIVSERKRAELFAVHNGTGELASDDPSEYDFTIYLTLDEAEEAAFNIRANDTEDTFTAVRYVPDSENAALREELRRQWLRAHDWECVWMGCGKVGKTCIESGCTWPKPKILC